MGIIFLIIGYLFIKQATKNKKDNTEKEKKSKKINVNTKVTYNNSSKNDFNENKIIQLLTKTDLLQIRGIKQNKIIQLYKLVVHNQDQNKTSKKAKTFLLGSNWQWPAFKKWRENFIKQDYFPHMWRSVKNKPSITEKADKIITQFYNLSEEAKTILLSNSSFTRKNENVIAIEDAARKSGFTKKDAMPFIEELNNGNFLNYPAGLEKKLDLLTKKELQGICEKYDLKKSGLKSEVIDRLIKKTPENELKEYLPPESRQDICIINIKLDPKSRNYIKWELEKINLYEHTLRMSFYTLRNYKGDYEYSINKPSEDPCPICKKANENVISKFDINNLPPLHPGCRCSIIPNINLND
ncbi:MAG: SAP domain-containing protein [Candidatus Woesearchaeota archaeon]